MEQRTINLVKHQIADGSLVLLHPKQLSIGPCRFKDRHGNTISIDVVKYKNL